jgi:hypothetical protein
VHRGTIKWQQKFFLELLCHTTWTAAVASGFNSSHRGLVVPERARRSISPPNLSPNVARISRLGTWFLAAFHRRSHSRYAGDGLSVRQERAFTVATCFDDAGGHGATVTPDPPEWHAEHIATIAC